MTREEALEALKNDPSLLMKLESRLDEHLKKDPSNAGLKKVKDTLSPLKVASPERGQAIREKLEKQEGPGIRKELAKVEPGFDLGAHATALKRGLAGTVASAEDVAGMGAALGASTTGNEERDWLAGPKRLWKTFSSDPGSFASRDPSLAIPSAVIKGIKELTIGNIQGMAPEAAEEAALEQLTSDEASMQKDPTSAFTETLGPAALGGLAGARRGIQPGVNRAKQKLGNVAGNIFKKRVEPYVTKQPPPLPIDETIQPPRAPRAPREPREFPVRESMIEEALPTGAPPFNLGDLRKPPPPGAPPFNAKDLPRPPSMLPEGTKNIPAPSGGGWRPKTGTEIGSIADELAADLRSRQVARREGATKDFGKIGEPVTPNFPEESIFAKRELEPSGPTKVSKRPPISLEGPAKPEQLPEMPDPFEAYKEKHVNPVMGEAQSTEQLWLELQQLLRGQGGGGPRLVKPKKD